MIEFKKARFVFSALENPLPPHVCSNHGQPLDEVAFIGRSNVGKSSLLNHLLQTKKLAKVSARPGKTQAINFFIADDQVALVDLPGYGFAKVSKKMKALWAEKIEAYLKSRVQLKLLLLLLDARRLPSQEDLELIEWALYYKKPFILVLTKYDKLKKNERKKQTEKIKETLFQQLGLKVSFYLYTIKNAHYRKLLIQEINNHLKNL